jgi:AraC-like DNA-binding protein
LSVSRFKLLFTKCTGKNTERVSDHAAHGKGQGPLLANTDLPISLVAEKTGYMNQSAFTRRFKSCHGISPSH